MKQVQEAVFLALMGLLVCGLGRLVPGFPQRETFLALDGRRSLTTNPISLNVRLNVALPHKLMLKRKILHLQSGPYSLQTVTLRNL